MYPFPYRAMPAALAGLLITTAAFGQPAKTSDAVADAKQSDAVKLSVFEVKTDKDIGYQSENAAEATRMNTPIRDIPMNVTIFNQQLIEDLIATNTSQLFAYEASTVKTTENDGFLARGSASVGSNYLDGFAQTGDFGSQPSSMSNAWNIFVVPPPSCTAPGVMAASLIAFPNRVSLTRGEPT